MTDLAVTDFKKLGAEGDLERVRESLLPHFLKHMGFDDAHIIAD